MGALVVRWARLSDYRSEWVRYGDYAPKKEHRTGCDDYRNTLIIRTGFFDHKYSD